MHISFNNDYNNDNGNINDEQMVRMTFTETRVIKTCFKKAGIRCMGPQSGSIQI